MRMKDKKFKYVFCMLCNADYVLENGSKEPICPECGLSTGIIINDWKFD